MRLNELEKTVLKKCLASFDVYIEDDDSFFADITVTERRFTGVGFFTDIETSEKLRIEAKNLPRVWGDFYATLNSNNDTGYLVFIEDEFINCIEGYTYGEVWPKNIAKIEEFEPDS